MSEALTVLQPEATTTNISLELAPGVFLTACGAVLDENVTFDDYCDALKKCQTLGNASLWAIGDMLLFGSQTYGEQYSQALELTRRSYSTLTQAKRLAKAYPPDERFSELSWTHHREALGIKDPDDRQRLLARAATEGWSREQVSDHVTGADATALVAHTHTCPKCGHSFN